MPPPQQINDADYRIAPPGALIISRRLSWIIGLFILILVVWRIQSPPVITIQRLDSPDGENSAFLQRTKYLKDHFRVRIKTTGPSFVAYISPPFDRDYRTDLGERLSWSEDGKIVRLQIQDRAVWEYDTSAEQGRDVDLTDGW
ncbi:MAG: hypothetical protein M5U15_01145 [Kiritimatiellae bacterium]|nr:hypothetical protein [Kiritimatiellia bacterium]